MNFNLEKNNLFDIARAFYYATGVRITIWNATLSDAVCYPENGTPFCQLMSSNPKASEQCWLCDISAIKKTDEKNCFIYHCHAGMTDCMIQIKEKGTVLGYISLGQISDIQDEQKRKKELLNVCRFYGFSNSESLSAINSVQFFPPEQIKAVAKIAEACASYIMTKNLIVLENSQIVSRAQSYITEHIFNDKNVTVKELCKDLCISRTSLYNAFQKDGSISVAKYIMLEKMKYARELLITTKLPIHEIAGKVGFDDYNYFSKVYKKEFGRTPKSYR